VKLLELVTVPAGVVTLTYPVVAPLGTVTETLVAEVTLNDADTPLNSTDVAPVKFVPLIVTTVSTFPLVGESPVIVAGTQNCEALVAVPAGVVTLTYPLVAPLGTVAEMLVAEFTVNDALTPLNLTAVAPVKFAPLTVTGAPSLPLVGDFRDWGEIKGWRRGSRMRCRPDVPPAR
jgi:hypothetical protein